MEEIRVRATVKVLVRQLVISFYHAKMFVLLSLSLSCSLKTNPPFQSVLCDTVLAADLACGSEGLEALCEAVKAAGLGEVLSSGTFTVFAPTTEAFATLPAERMADVDNLTNLLLYHVVPGQKLMSSDLPCVAGENTIEMANGKDTRTRCVKSVPELQKGIGNDIDDAPAFVTVDVEACNGVVHVIDGVLLDANFS